ncbi:MAG: response regulator [Elusimicrobiota bacterium]
MKILIADDNRHILNIIKDSLENLDIEIDTALNGEEALYLMRSNEGAYNLLITDINMDDMTGVELAKKSREIDPDIKIIGISGSRTLGMVSKDIKEEDRKLFDKFLFKPFSIYDLRAMVNGLLV